MGFALLLLSSLWSGSPAKAMPVPPLSAITAGLGHSLTAQQAAQVERVASRLQENAPPPDEHKVSTLLVCLGGVAAFIAQGQVAICSDLRGHRYYLGGIGFGAVFGAAGQVFVFNVLHRRDHPIAFQFHMVGLGGTFGTVADYVPRMEKIFEALSFLGPEFGVFGSVLDDQTGVLAGVNIGKLLGVHFDNIMISSSAAKIMQALPAWPSVNPAHAGE